MIAPRLAIRPTPSAKVSANTAGSPSGTVATASATALIAMSAADCPRTNAKAAYTAMAIPPITVMRLPTASSCTCRGVLGSSLRCSMSAIAPTSVSDPVAVTTISARPRVSAVLAYAMQLRSASGTGAPA